ncbi:hypothetical protein PCASD_21315 [Puccinia coronata f. sp. avenae]|uniref:Uncharacterized protein n=1 Tax=Puccinia coronata f. sp. avenae TaxID=200324 RepID=A0A2N5SKE7_9BASI|nr:hypothetical protein PCASD_21315 [Puccinia coronata f. sp. avenae]
MSLTPTLAPLIVELLWADQVHVAPTVQPLHDNPLPSSPSNYCSLPSPDDLPLSPRRAPTPLSATDSPAPPTLTPQSSPQPPCPLTCQHKQPKRFGEWSKSTQTPEDMVTPKTW